MFLTGSAYLIVAISTVFSTLHKLKEMKNDYCSILIPSQKLALEHFDDIIGKRRQRCSIYPHLDEVYFNWFDPSPTHVSDTKTGSFMLLETLNVVLLIAFRYAVFIFLIIVLASLMLTSCLVALNAYLM